MSDKGDFGDSKVPLPMHLLDENSPAVLKQQLAAKDAMLSEILKHTDGTGAFASLARTGLSASPDGNKLIEERERPSDKTATVASADPASHGKSTGKS